MGRWGKISPCLQTPLKLQLKGLLTSKVAIANISWHYYAFPDQHLQVICTGSSDPVCVCLFYDIRLNLAATSTGNLSYVCIKLCAQEWAWWSQATATSTVLHSQVK